MLTHVWNNNKGLLLVKLCLSVCDKPISKNTYAKQKIIQQTFLRLVCRWRVTIQKCPHSKVKLSWVRFIIERHSLPMLYFVVTFLRFACRIFQAKRSSALMCYQGQCNNNVSARLKTFTAENSLSDLVTPSANKAASSSNHRLLSSYCCLKSYDPMARCSFSLSPSASLKKTLTFLLFLNFLSYNLFDFTKASEHWAIGM